MGYHLRQRLDALSVGDLVQQTLHHGNVPIGRQVAGLDVSLFADYVETRFVSESLGELAHELALRSAVAFPEGMDTIYLG